MDFEEQRRMYAMNIPGHPIASHHAGSQQTTAQQVAQQVAQQQVSQQAPHNRILMPEGPHAMVVGTRHGPMDATMATMTSQMAGSQQITMHHTVHHQQLVHHQQQVVQQQTTQQQQQMLTEVTVSIAESSQETGTGLAGVVEEVPVEVEGHERILGLERECDVDENIANIHSMQKSWCLICDKSLPVPESSSEMIDLYKATMTVSQRKLSAMLGRLIGLTLYKAHSTSLCRRCFELVDQVDGLEIELADTKMELVQQYEATISHRQPHAKREIEKPSLEVDVEWDESNESDILDNIEDDPDCTATGAKKRKRKKARRKGGRPRKIRVTTKGKLDTQNEEESEERPRKRGRGRPRKKDKEDDEFIPPEAPTKSCPSCKKVIHAKKYLNHLSTHRLFPCPFCESVYKRKDIKTHLAEAHQEEIHYPCTECDDVFDTFMQLRQHCLVIHMGIEREQYICKLCNKKFSSPTGLKVHVETIHEKVQVFECPTCKETFNQKGNMQNHFRRVHQGDEARKLLCDICNKGFICPSDLRKHVERVHLKVRKNEVMCEVCGKPFSDSRAMRIHINAVHTKEVQHPCPECKMVFHSLTNMVTHRRRMHGGPEGRKNVCEICGKGFCSPSDLKTHIRVVHENVRKYVCDICGQAFKVCSHLKYHRRKHTGETPYECPHCGKCFHGPSHISDHVKKVHKTVYIGANQRRKLNLPESAPPPPPGMLPPREMKLKQKPMTPPMNMVHPTYSQPMACAIPASGVSTFAPAHHTTNMLPPTQGNPSMIHHQGLMEHHNPYTNFQFQTVEQNSTQQSPVPMVVRLLHDLQYQ
ncbi:zinc finger and SCAN domain-containing protein 12-like isoform X1 [Macrobrachium nipponense]|uniref:zinc finger and SCAN domain-containing protein 12-like isoform X1 n=1 Tax=Macrobrachium nipponense TaxID=159736 RepID=UPI0030C81835